MYTTIYEIIFLIITRFVEIYNFNSNSFFIFILYIFRIYIVGKWIFVN